jgi:hypothetical protein
VDGIIVGHPLAAAKWRPLSLQPLPRIRLIVTKVHRELGWLPYGGSGSPIRLRVFQTPPAVLLGSLGGRRASGRHCTEGRAALLEQNEQHQHNWQYTDCDHADAKPHFIVHPFGVATKYDSFVISGSAAEMRLPHRETTVRLYGKHRVFPASICTIDCARLIHTGAVFHHEQILSAGGSVERRPLSILHKHYLGRTDFDPIPKGLIILRW